MLKKVLCNGCLMLKKTCALKRMKKLMDKRRKLIAKHAALGIELETKIHNYHEKFYGGH